MMKGKKILMLARPNLLAYPGGDTTQILQTAEHLRQAGLIIDINPTTISYDQYDLVHFFNIIDPEDILGHLPLLQQPYVISTIYVLYEEYDRYYREDLIRFAYRFFSRFGVEYMKIVAKWLLKGEQISTYKFFWYGYRRSIQQILRGASCLLPNSENEYRRLLADFGMEKEYVVVPNGVDAQRFSIKEEQERRNILCVSRIEGQKNQFNLIRAIEGTDLPLFIVGQAAKNQQGYFRKCQQVAGEKVHFTGFISQQDLWQYYQEAKVHVLPSWFETTGLVSLEAALMGCNVVISNRGDVRDYFQDDAWYCDPTDPDSIRQAILEAYNAPVSSKLADRVRREYNWQNAAKMTIQAYEKALS